MNALRRLAILWSDGPLRHRGAATQVRDTIGARALRLFGLADRDRQVRSTDSEPPSDCDEADFAPDTDVLVFFMETDPVTEGVPANLEKLRANTPS